MLNLLASFKACFGSAPGDFPQLTTILILIYLKLDRPCIDILGRTLMFINIYIYRLNKTAAKLKKIENRITNIYSIEIKCFQKRIII